MKKILNPLFAVLATVSWGAGAAKAAQLPSPLSAQNRQELARLLAAPAGKFPFSCSDRAPPGTPATALDRFLLWNEIALDTTAIDHTPDPDNPGCFGVQLGPHRASRALAIVHIAIFDALNAISKEYKSYTGIPPVSGDVSRDMAIARAAHDTLLALYPAQQARLDAILGADISHITGSPAAIAAGAALGAKAASAILGLRENDGSELKEPAVMTVCNPPSETCFPQNTAPGKWQIDPISKLTVALGAHWGQVRPFVLKSAAQFRSAPPPALSNPAYVRAWDAVYAIGGDPAHGTATSRTRSQTHTGVFFGYDGTPGLCAPPRIYNQIVRKIALQQEIRSVSKMARLFALANVAMADAGIASWESKYFYQYWRPVTGIRNAATNADPSWYPLGAPDTNTAGPNFTPPFPSYPSGHAALGGALFEILRKFWPDDTPFQFTSDEWNGKNEDINGNVLPLWPIRFHSFREAELENAQSRIYLGIHWQFDADMGIWQGNQVARYVFGHAFRPVDDGGGDD